MESQCLIRQSTKASTLAFRNLLSDIGAVAEAHQDHQRLADIGQSQVPNVMAQSRIEMRGTGILDESEDLGQKDAGGNQRPQHDLNLAYIRKAFVIGEYAALAVRVFNGGSSKVGGVGIGIFLILGFDRNRLRRNRGCHADAHGNQQVGRNTGQILTVAAAKSNLVDGQKRKH